MANHLRREKRVAIVNLMCEGCSIRSVERITGVHRDTIGRLLLRVGKHCERIMADRLAGLQCDQLEIDELWTFGGQETATRRPGRSYRVWGRLHVHRDGRVSKVVIHHETGKRDEFTTDRFMGELSRRVEGHTHIAVDGFPAYPTAIQDWFRGRADAMAVVKNFRTDDPEHRYSPGKVTGCIRYAIQGFPRRSRSTTSHVERSELDVPDVREAAEPANGRV